MGITKFTDKQARFIDEYLIDCNCAAAAVRAGYSPKTARVTGPENLSKPAIARAIQARQAADSERMGVSRDRVIAGLLGAVDLGRENRQPLAMIRAWTEIAKLLNLYQPQEVRVEVDNATAHDFARMTDAELVGFIEAAKALSPQ